MLINNINPILLELGPLQIRYYGLVYSLGFLIGYFVLRAVAKKGRIKNLTLEKSDSLIIYMMIGLIAGARLLMFVFYQPMVLINDPVEIFRIWNGGMSFHGGIIGCFLAAHIYCRKHKINFYQLADLMVIPGAFFLFLGRIANFINGELVGIKSNVPWCVVFKNFDDACRHPSQLYEAGKNLIIFSITLFMYTKKKLKDGIVFWGFVLLYGVLRFIENFWREDPRLFGISQGQYLSLIMIPIAIYFLLKINRKKH